MDFFIGIRKFRQASLLFFAVCIAANAASIVQFYEFPEEYEGVASTSQAQKVGNSFNESNKQEKRSSLLDKHHSFIIDLSREIDKRREKEYFFGSTANEMGDGMERINTLQNTFYFNNNANTGAYRSNQSEMVDNGRQLKMLADDLFDKEMLKDVLMAKNEAKILFNQTDAWIKDVLFDDSSWRLEDAIYGSAAFLFVNDSSLAGSLGKIEGNSNVIQNEDYFGSQYIDQEGEMDFELGNGLFYIIEFLKKNTKNLVFLFVSILIIQESIKYFSRKKHRSKARFKRSSSEGKEIENTTGLLFSPQGRVIGQKSEAGRNKDEHSSRRRRHRNGRRKPKRSLLRKIADAVFG
jgi:hypothetical protein